MLRKLGPPLAATALLGVALASHPARAEVPAALRSLIGPAGVRVIVVRAAGADHRWRALPGGPGLRLRVLADCEAPSSPPRLCDPRRRLRRRLGLEEGQAAVWDWRGRQLAASADADRVQGIVARHLGPKPRVWVEAPDAKVRSALADALSATGRWSITHRIQDAAALSAARRIVQTASKGLASCALEAVPRLSLLTATGENTVWVDAKGACAYARAGGPRRGRRPKEVVAQLEARWREGISAPTPRAALAPTRPLRGRADDAHLRKEIRVSLAALDSVGETPLTAAVRPWVGTRYRRNGDDVSGIDDFNLVRALYRDVYGITLSTNALDWLTKYEKVPIDESRPEATIQPGDILFKVTLGYRPRQVLLYLGGGMVVAALQVQGVVIKRVPKNLSVKYYLVARRPLADR